MQSWAIGDVHGCGKTLDKLVQRMALSQGDEVEFILNDAGFIEVHPLAATGPLAFAGVFTELFEGFDLEKERSSWNR